MYLLIQEISTKLQNQVVAKPDGSVENQDVDTEIPKTGDTSIMGLLVLGSMALLALIKNMKIKDKLFLK